MRFGTRVLVTRGGGTKTGTPGCRRTIKGILVGACGNERFVKLSEDDPLDTVGWNTRGHVGHWGKSAVKEERNCGDLRNTLAQGIADWENDRSG